MLLIFTGSGKGKTSSAVGLALRAWGQGKRVLFISFLKDCFRSGEFKAMLKIQSPTLVTFAFGRDCPYNDEDCCPGECECIVTSNNKTQDDYEIIRQGLEISEKELDSKLWDVIIFDELINVYNLFPELKEIILGLLRHNSPDCDLILTGRECSPELLKEADLVSEVNIIKHPFSKGITAKRGIDY